MNIGVEKQKTIMMGIFTFLFLCIEYLYVDIVSGMVSEAKAVTIQNYALGVSAAGFLLYPVFNRLCKGLLRTVCMVIETLISVVCICLVCINLSYELTLISGLILFLLLGIVGSAVFYIATCMSDDDRYLARTVGVAYMLGILLQFINNNVVASYVAEAVVISVFMVILAGMLLANSHTYRDRMLQKTEKKIPDETAKGYRNIYYITGALLVVLIVLMSCVFSTLDNAVTLVHATGTIDIGQLPRILLAVSGIVAGLLFDIKGRKFMSLIMYCMMMLSTICIAVLKFAGPFVEALAIFYITAGFFVVFFTTSFMEYSRYTGLPDLWAGMGRAVNNITAAVFTGASLTLLSSGEYISIIMLVVIMFVAVSVVTAIYIHFRNTLLEIEAAQEETDSLSEEEKLQQIAVKYDFTEREIQAFKLLVVTEESIQNIADNMNVSKRTLERYVSAIYKKTGVKSRVGLINIYNE